MRIIADYDRCEAYGECVKAVPEAFEIHDDEMYVLQEHPPEHLRRRLESAVVRCPMQALSMRD